MVAAKSYVSLVQIISCPGSPKTSHLQLFHSVRARLVTLPAVLKHLCGKALLTRHALRAALPTSHHFSDRGARRAVIHSPPPMFTSKTASSMPPIFRLSWKRRNEKKNLMFGVRNETAAAAVNDRVEQSLSDPVSRFKAHCH